MKAWSELTRKEQLAAEHWDFYKAVHGFRPRHVDYDAATESELEALMAELARLSKQQEAA